MVYVLTKESKPLMPTNRHGHVRRLLKAGKAKVVRRLFPAHAGVILQAIVYSSLKKSVPRTRGGDPV